MNGAPTPPPRRSHAPTAIVATLLAIGAATAADTAASAAPATPSQRLQQRLTAAVEGWRKAVVKLPDAKEHEAQMVRELRVVVAPTAVPLLHVQRRLEGNTIVVSAGWLAMLDELLRADAVSTSAADLPPYVARRNNRDCLAGFGPLLLSAIADNRNRADATPPRPLQAMPKLVLLIEAGDPPPGCANLKRTDLQRPSVQARVDDDADVAALWLLTRQAALLVALPVTAVSASAESGSTTARGRASTSATEFAERRAQQALDEYGLTQPRALRWLRAQAALFDAEPAVPALPR